MNSGVLILTLIAIGYMGRYKIQVQALRVFLRHVYKYQLHDSIHIEKFLIGEKAVLLNKGSDHSSPHKAKARQTYNKSQLTLYGKSDIHILMRGNAMWKCKSKCRYNVTTKCTCVQYITGCIRVISQFPVINKQLT